MHVQVDFIECTIRSHLRSFFTQFGRRSLHEKQAAAIAAFPGTSIKHLPVTRRQHSKLFRALCPAQRTSLKLSTRYQGYTYIRAAIYPLCSQITLRRQIHCSHISLSNHAVLRAASTGRGSIGKSRLRYHEALSNRLSRSWSRSSRFKKWVLMSS